MAWGRRLALAITASLVTSSLGTGVAAQSGSPAPAWTLFARVDRAIADLMFDLGLDPEAARAWVVTNVAPERYAGIMKGARGTFLARGANSADQALLLGEMLRTAGWRSRYAVCELDARPASAGVEAGPATPEQSLTIDEVAELVAAEVTDAELKDALLAIPPLWDSQVADVESATSELAAALEDIPLADSAASTEMGAPRDQHVWLQVEWGAEWKDLDTTTPTGEPLCEPDEVGDLPPEGLYHRVRISLEVEQRLRGEFERTALLSLDRPVADLATSSIAFTFGEPSGYLERGPIQVGEPAPYTPVLAIDGELVTGDPIWLPALSGSLLPINDELEQIGEELFGTPAPGAGDEEEDPYTGAWLLIDLVAPDGSVTAIRSEVFDRIGLEARAATSLDAVPIKPFEQVLAEYTPMSALWQVGLFVGESLAPEAIDDEPLSDLSTADLSRLLDGLLRSFPSLHRHLGGRPDFPMIVLAGLTDEITTQGDAGNRLLLDAVHVPALRADGPLAAARDAQAVIGAEAILTGLLGLTSQSLDESAGVFRAARAASSPLILLAPGDPIAIAGASPEALIRMGERLGAGYSLLTPASAPSAGGSTSTAWWVIDPSTGIVRDEHESGRHADLTTYSGNTSRALSSAQKFCRFGRSLGAAIVFAVAVFISAMGGKIPSGIKAVAKTATAAYEQRRRGKKAVDIACLTTGAKGPPLP
jgi:hypothetical protein